MYDQLDSDLPASSPASRCLHSTENLYPWYARSRWNWCVEPRASRPRPVSKPARMSMPATCTPARPVEVVVGVLVLVASVEAQHCGRAIQVVSETRRFGHSNAGLLCTLPGTLMNDADERKSCRLAGSGAFLRGGFLSSLFPHSLPDSGLDSRSEINERLPRLRMHQPILDCDEPSTPRFRGDDRASESLLLCSLGVHRLAK